MNSPGGHDVVRSFFFAWVEREQYNMGMRCSKNAQEKNKVSPLIPFDHSTP